jgi:glutamate dehydrogenase/leucine dehydrogenase
MTLDVVAATGSHVDDLGPEAVVLLRHPPTGVTAIVVVDNTAGGPAIGGVRMAPDVTVEEVARLARSMTLKNAAARLPHGGAKAGIIADPTMPAAEKEVVVRWFAGAIRDLRSYIPGPDMGTDERCMAWVHDEIGRSVGLPAALGGIPLDELGATGFGLAIAAEAAEAAGVVALQGARVAVQGFGAVGRHVARFLSERGARLVAASDSQGALVDPDGLPVEELIAWSRAGRPLVAFDRAGGGAARADREALIAVDCDILVPAARPDVITEANVDDVRTRMVLEGANIPLTAKAEAVLHDRGVLCLPDWIVNAGGVICGSVEHAGGTRALAFAQIEETVRANTATVIAQSAEEGELPRDVADRLAVSRVREAMALRRSYG